MASLRKGGKPQLKSCTLTACTVARSIYCIILLLSGIHGGFLQMLNYVEKGLILSVCSRLEILIEELGDLEAKCKCCQLVNLEGEEQLSFSPPVSPH